MRSGTVIRIGPTFGYGKAVDESGAKASHRWDPRCCQKGLALVRRFYGDRRCKYPLVRKGWLERAGPASRAIRAAARSTPSTCSAAKTPSSASRGMKPLSSRPRASRMCRRATTATKGKKWLLSQGFDPEMVETTHGVGTQVIKMRGGMPLLGITRIFGQYRFANTLALLDAHTRRSVPTLPWGRAAGTTTWHTDLPPGHPMVTGQQTVDWDLAMAERAKLLVVWGMNWITTKMPDSHWLTEARLKGTKIAVIAAEYSATMNKADLALIVRPGTTPALALGLSQVILSEKLYDADYIKAYTDLPSLVRMDTLERLDARDVGGLKLVGGLAAKVLKKGEKAPPATQQTTTVVPEALEAEAAAVCRFGDQKTGKPAAVTRDEVGARFRKRKLDPQLSGHVEVQLADGKTVTCRPVFDLIEEYVNKNFTPPKSRPSPGRRQRGAGSGARDREEPRRHTVRRLRHGAESVLQQRPQRPRDLLLGVAHPQRRLRRWQRRVVCRQLPHRLLQRPAAVRLRRSIRHRAR